MTIIGKVTQSEQGTFVVPDSDTVIGESLRRNGYWGWNDVQQWKSFIAADQSVLVIGAHIGTTVVPLSRVCKRVWAYEPNPETFQYLKANLSLNGCDNVTALMSAISDKQEKLRFRVNRGNSGGSKRVPLHDQPMYNEADQKEIEVSAGPIGSEHPVFDIVIMDCEGSEYFALRGMGDHLSKVRTLVVEFLPHHLKNVAGVTPEDFAALLVPHFDTMEIPKLRQKVGRADFATALRKLYDFNHEEDGLIFRKEVPAAPVAFLDPTLI